MTQTLNAIQMRANLLATFPDASAPLRDDFVKSIHSMTEVILEFISEEQRLLIFDRVSQVFGDHGE